MNDTGHLVINMQLRVKWLFLLKQFWIGHSVPDEVLLNLVGIDHDVQVATHELLVLISEVLVYVVTFTII